MRHEFFRESVEPRSDDSDTFSVPIHFIDESNLRNERRSVYSENKIHDEISNILVFFFPFIPKPYEILITKYAYN